MTYLFIFTEKSLLPPFSLPPLLEKSPRDSEPSVKLAAEYETSVDVDSDAQTATSVPRDPPNGLIPDPLLPEGHHSVASVLYDEASATGNRRTNVLFRKSKSTSPQKPPKMAEASAVSPPLGTKTFLSVVIPRLETLLLPRKRTRSSSADGEDEEDEESPIKRLGTGTVFSPKS